MTRLRNIELTKQKFFDTGNSSSDLLGIGGVFTGTWVDTSDYVSAIISLVIDQDAAIDGLRLETSRDGVTVLHSHVFTPLTNTPDGHHYPTTLDAQFFRVKYTNGAVAQTIFNLNTTLFKIPPERSHVHPVEYQIDSDHPSTIGRSILLAKKPAGTYVNIGCTTGENLKVAVEEIEPEASDLLTDYVAGTGSNGSISLVSANTAYAIPGSTPASNYKITVQNNSDVPVFIGYQNTNTDGIQLDPGDIAYDSLGAGQQLFAYCGSAGKSVVYTTKLVS